MKQLIILLLLNMTSCSYDLEMRVAMRNNNSRNFSIIKCDSVQMISKSEAEIYINGTKTKIFADEIRVYNQR